MSFAHGIELHCTEATTPGGYLTHDDAIAEIDTFYRVIQVDNVLHLRWGHRGTPGHTDTLELASTHEASATRSHIANAHRFEHHYVVVFDAALPEPTPIDRIDPTHLFEMHWADRAVRAITPSASEPPVWAAIAGLSGLRGKDIGADAMHDYLIARPHALERTGNVDAMIAPIAQLHESTTTPRVWTGFEPAYTDHVDRTAGGPRLTAHELGPLAPRCAHAIPMCAPCTLRTAELILFLLRGHRLELMPFPTRRSIPLAAQRLLSASTSRSPSCASTRTRVR